VLLVRDWLEIKSCEKPGMAVTLLFTGGCYGHQKGADAVLFLSELQKRMASQFRFTASLVFDRWFLSETIPIRFRSHSLVDKKIPVSMF